MAHTYYSRLTLVHPQAASKLDPRLGVVIAETATTGRFILSDIVWESAVSPNSLTTVAFHGGGDLKIQEPLGMSLLDYIRAASFEVGIENHIDARFLLEIEILAENLPSSASPFKYVWPIMFIATEVKSSLSEKGTEYNIKFVHQGGHAQTDLVQPIKEALTIEKASNLKDFFQGLQNKLEEREYKYAKARQKAGSANSPGGNNPAKKDDYHDEYHFILEPRLEDPSYTFTTKGPADRGVQADWKNFLPWTTNSWNITMRPGTSIMNQITTVMQSIKKIADLMPNRPKPMTADASGSSERSTENINSMLSNVYQFFRVETHSVYKLYDYIRGRYAVKHVFLIYLADQPNMYQYPDEIDLLNKLSNRSKVELKLKYYIQEGLLQKIYYHNYTGLNTDILKVDLQFNQTYSLPTFTQIWADRGQTGPGMMNLQNYNKRINPFIHRDDKGVRGALNDLKQATAKIAALASGMLNDKGQLKENTATRQQEYKALQNALARYKEVIAEKEQELATISQPKTPLNAINNRKDLFDSLKGYYVEDINFKNLVDKFKEIDFPSLRPRMEIDVISESVDIVKDENERLMEKIFAVQLSPRDLMELELEIIADPYWLGVPNIIAQGKKHLSNIELPSKTSEAITAKLNSVMPSIDFEWNTKEPVWGNYGAGAQWYKGSPLLYFNSQVPDSVFDNDKLRFNNSDQIIGIYQVKFVVNEFKNGLWTQKLKTVRDPTIPSHALPRGLTGDMTFEDYIKDVDESSERAIDKINQLQKEAEDRQKALNNNQVPGVVAPTTTQLNPKMASALEIQKELLKEKPAPSVVNPVEYANTLVASQNKSRQEAYALAKEKYTSDLNAHNAHMEKINKEAYETAGVTDVVPYNAATMTSLATTRSGNGGLEDWKFNRANPNTLSTAKSNNPAGIGYDSETKMYYKYGSFNDGMTAANEYFNYGNGVKQVGVQGADRLLMPAKSKANQLEYIKEKLKGGN